MSLVIKGGTVVGADRSYQADVLVEGEKIAQIGPNLKGDTTLDGTDCFVMPGGIDPHTHLEMPFMGTTSTDHYESGTKAALSGGTTMVVDFCIPGNGQPLMEAWADWDKRSKTACADYAYHMCITYWSDKVREDMAKVVEKGVTTFKHFMAYKGALMVNDEEMFASFQRCAELGAMPLVHAENGDIVAMLQAKYLKAGITGPEGHALSRPPEVEGEATNRAIMIADQAGCPLYVVHTSCIQAHEAIRRARAKGMRVYGEPLIQHLILDESEYYNKDWTHAARRVMSPPFRDKKNQDDLWNGLQSRLAPCRGDRPLRLHDGAENVRQRRFHQNPERHRRSRRPHAAAVDLRRRRRAPDDERIRRGHLDQYRAHPQPLSEEGRDHSGRGRGHRRLGPEGVEDDLRRDPALGDRLQRVRRREGAGPAALHALARRGALARRAHPGRARPRQVRQARPVPGRSARARGLEEAYRRRRRRAIAC